MPRSVNDRAIGDLVIIFMRDNQPYYYFDGYKMGQEEKKSEEHQGHHCTGKCTKLESEISSKIVEGECKTFKGIERNRKLEWNSKEKEADPFWLKVGDVLKEKDTNLIIKLLGESEFKNLDIDCFQVEALAPDGKPVKGSVLKLELTKDKFKKIKLVSPALIKDNTSGIYSLSKNLYPYDEGIIGKEFSVEDLKNIIWPAKDQFGKEIWYEVEE